MKRNNNIKVTSVKNNGSKSASILLEGDLTLNTLPKTKERIATAINNYDALNIEVKNIDSFELPWIQLLFAIKKTSQKLNKSITFNISLPENVRTIVEHAGFNHLYSL